ncbi:Centromere/kinetochore Zw10-domain-containing protein [Tricharina praecox]|uniref:Centromere/kinetochore Zw10-domain-containing protein n=1 Tax=Tricharina praecox TaxID=43433 RepID=UPI002221177D|nr:Centromere/kinetochore Zw10-domain-containing protein [Tricharina praecox]KAI5857585.1 Centromere/kinetochore Zw10-domain-containing protein [Tricharina praecox]
MVPSPDPATLADVILRSATEGYYPDSEEIAAANLTSVHLPTILESLNAAKDDIKEQVRTISRDNATSIDSWITQARQLHLDVEASKAQADQILKLDEEEKALAQAVGDAETHQRFLEAEIQFNETLASVLGKLQLIGTTLAQVDIAIGRGELGAAVGILNGAEDALERLRGFDDIIVAGLMKEKARLLRKALLETVERTWSGLVNVDKDSGTVVVRKSANVLSTEFESEEVVEALDILGLLKDKIDHFHQQIDRVLIVPRLETQQGRIPNVAVDGDAIRIAGQDNDLSAARLFSDLRLIIDFLNTQLPSAVMSNLSRTLIPSLISRLISTRLSSSVPPSLENLPAFEELLKETKRFEDGLHDANLTRERELSDWVERAPKVWLAKRRESCLDAARKVMASGVGEVEQVERSETQTIDAEDGQGALVAGVADISGAEDWNAAWNEEEDNVASDEQPKQETLKRELEKPVDHTGFIEEDDDDGANGWGLDEDLGLDDHDEPPKETELTSKSEEPTLEFSTPQEQDDDIGWGSWADDADGDDREDHDPVPVSSGAPKHSRKPSVQASASSHVNKTSAPKDITLTETYTITSTPRALLSLITSLLSEATQLENNPQYKSSSIASAASGILTVPTLVLAIFRALAPLYYAVDLKSNMYLYNDCTFLSSELPPEVNERDVSQIVTFGKRQYSHEMEAQRTILNDYLDGSQGFVSCDDPLQRQECNRAVAATTSRLREIYNAWKTVLSKSALYQSMGSLLNAVITKLINDIEDLSDISEPESVALAAYCADLGSLGEELFPGRNPGTPPITAIYCGNWVKFRYLEQLLQSSLADIMMLASEGCLKDFEEEEVVELIRALFADTEVRGRCIEDIRRQGLLH